MGGVVLGIEAKATKLAGVMITDWKQIFCVN